ncbi:MAG: ribosome rescue protein RqcH, partial [Candidatus Bathyarchaeia archaeon]
LNEKYLFPTSKGLEPRQVTAEALEVLRKADTDTVRALTKHLAIGGTYAEEFLKRAEIGKDTLAKNLNPAQIKRLASEIQKIAVQLEMPQAQVVLDREENMLDVTPFPLAIYANNKTIPYSTLSGALDDYFSKLAAAKTTELAKREFESQKEEATRIQTEQTKKLKQLEQDRDNFRIIGQAIRDNSFEFQELIHLVVKKRNEGKNWPDIERDLKVGKTPQAFTGLEPIRKAISLRFGDLKCELDIRLSAYENASRYFEQSKEAKAKTTSVTRALAETEEKKTSAESRTAQLAPERPIPLREKTWYEKFNHFFTSENFLVVGGRDSSSNETLIKRHTSPEDIVLHAEIIGAPFTVIKTAGRNPSEHSILEAAQFGACYSRAWRELLGSVDMYWIQPTQLSKSPPAGQYLARGAFMIYGKRNYLRKIPLKLAVGFIAEPNPKIFGGTSSSVSQKTQNFVEIVPGNIEAKVLCENIKRDLAQKAPKEHRPEILRTSIESMRTLIPFGKAHIFASANRVSLK